MAAPKCTAQHGSHEHPRGEESHVGTPTLEESEGEESEGEEDEEDEGGENEEFEGDV